MARKGIPVLDFDDLITAIQALSAPSATNVAVDPTGMEIITAENAQGALKQLDTAVDSVNASLTNFTSERHTINFTYTSTTNHYATGTHNIAKSGHTPIGLKGWNIYGESSSLAFAPALFIEGNLLTYVIRNTNPNSMAVDSNTLDVYVEYKPN